MMAETLAPVRAREHARRGALIVDLRSPEAFAHAHPAAAINLPYSPRSLAERLAVVLELGTPVILLAENQAQAEGAGAQLRDGPFPVRGVVEGGLPAWQAAGLPIQTLPILAIQELASLTPSVDTILLDVREPMEWETGHVPGATLVSLGNLRGQLHRLPQQARIVVICESGLRSSAGASLLKANGFARVANVLGGTSGYRRAGLPLHYPDEIAEEG